MDNIWISQARKVWKMYRKGGRLDPYLEIGPNLRFGVWFPVAPFGVFGEGH